MAEEYLIEKGINPRVDSELDNLTQKANKLAEVLGKINNLGDVYGGGDAYKNVISATQQYENAQKRLIEVQKQTYDEFLKTQAQTNEHIKLRKEELGLTQKKIQLSIQERIEQQQRNAVEKLNAIATSESSTQLQKLYALQELANRKAQSEFVPGIKQQSQAFIDSARESANYSKQILQLEQATGKVGSKIRSANPVVFSFSQILREAPNFVQSTRIGLMSLSNNVPMFLSDLQNMARAIDENTGKAVGWGKAFKTLGKEMLSFNAIAVIATTLILIFQDDIEKFITKLFETKNAFEDSIKANREYNKSILEGIKSSQDELVHLRILYNATQDTTRSTKERKIAVNELQKLYPDYFKNLKDEEIFAGKASKAYDDLTSSILKSAMARAKEALVVQNQIKILELSQKVTEAEIMITSMSLSAKGMKNGRMAVKIEMKKYIDEIKLSSDEIKKLEEQNRNIINSIDIIPTKPKTEKPKIEKSQTEKVVQTGKEMLVALKAYNAEREKLILENKDLEDKITKESNKGVLNDFESRKQYAKKYYENTLRILEIDRANSEYNTKENARKQLNQIENDNQHNEALYKAKKISYSRYIELTQQYNDAVVNLTSNTNTDLLEISDKYHSGEKEATIKFGKEILTIEKDIYDEQVKNIDIASKEKTDAIKRSYEEQKKALEKMSTAEIIGSVLVGYTKQTKVSDAVNKRIYNFEENQVEIDKIKEKLDIVKKGGIEEKNLRDELWKAQKKQIDDQNSDTKDIESAIDEEHKDLKTAIAEKTVDMLKEIWSDYWQWELKKIETQKKKYDKIEKEKLADIEDRENAGVLSKKQAEEEKASTQAYYQSVQDELDRKKAEKEKQKFLFEQGISLAKVWINFAEATSSLENMLTGGAMTPLYLALALVSSGLIIAQTVPQFFANGGIVREDKPSVLGDGGKREMVKLPNNKFFISPDVPTMYNLPKGTEIFPDATQYEKQLLQKHLVLTQVKGNGFDEKAYMEMRDLNRTLKSKRMSVNVNVGNQLNNIKYLAKWTRV